MKNLVLALVAFVAVSGVVNANDLENPASPAGIAVTKIGSTFKLFYKASKPSNVRVIIYNSKDEAVFSETLKNVTGFVRPYNFSSLSEGEYRIELIDEEGKKVERVAYYTERDNKSVNIMPVKGQDGKYLLLVANTGNDFINVKIYNKDNSVIYNETESVNGNFAKVYNLNKVEGNVSFEVTDSYGVVKTLTF